MLDLCDINIELQRPIWCIAVQNTMLADGKFTPEAFLHHIFDPYAERLNIYLTDDFIRKSIQQEHPGIFFTDATLPEIEQGFAVKLPCGRTMRTFHIIRIDLQERF